MIAFLALVGRAHGEGLPFLLTSWDGRNFRLIAEYGYSHRLAGGTLNSVAFFPAYPNLIKWLHHLTGLGLGRSGLLISLVSAIIFCYGLVRLTRLLLTVQSRRAELIMVALVSLGPLSVVFSMVYSEALFCALAVWALVFLIQERWILAGVLIAVDGTVRQASLALCVALAAGVIRALVLKRGTWQMWLAVVIAPTGALGYLWWVDQHTHQTFGWFKAQWRGWRSGFDFGQSTVEWLYHRLVVDTRIVDLATVAAGISAIVLLVIMRRSRPEIVSYAAAVVAIAFLSSGVYHSKLRLLIPAFVLFLPIADWLSGQPLRRIITAVAFYGAVGIWYSGWALGIWNRAI